ncbi:hypothetical protein ACLOJK_039986 [Asimina triloba]
MGLLMVVVNSHQQSLEAIRLKHFISVLWLELDNVSTQNITNTCNFPPNHNLVGVLGWPAIDGDNQKIVDVFGELDGRTGSSLWAVSLCGVVAYPARELPSKSSYAPASPPTTLGAPHSGSDTELQIMISPPLAPLGTGSGEVISTVGSGNFSSFKVYSASALSGFAESPSPTSPYAPPPVLERAPMAGYPGKPLGINSSSPLHPVPKGPISSLPAALPPKPTRLATTIGEPAEAPQPTGAPSHHMYKEHKHTGKDPPFTKNQTTPLPGVGPISPLAALPPKSTLPLSAIMGPIEAPRPPSSTSQQINEEILPTALPPKSTLPHPTIGGLAEAPQLLIPTSQDIHEEHKHTRKDSPYMKVQAPHLPGPGTISPLPSALPPKSTLPPPTIDGPADTPQPSSTTSHHKHKRNDSPTKGNQAPRFPGTEMQKHTIEIKSVDKVSILLNLGPSSPLPAALPPNSTLPSPTIERPAEPPQPLNATSQHKHEEHKHTRKDSSSMVSMSPNLRPISPLRTALPPKSTLPPPAIEGGPAAPPQPPKVTSQHIHEEHKHTQKDSPPTNNHASGLPGVAPVPSPPTALQWTPPVMHVGIPGMAPSSTSGVSPVTSAPPQEGPDLSKLNNRTSSPTSFSNPKPPEGKRIQDPAPAPAVSFYKNNGQKNISDTLPVPSPSTSFHEHHTRKDASSPASAPSHLFPLPSYHKGLVSPLVPSQAPIVFPNKSRHRSPSPAASSKGPLSPRKTPFPPTNPGAPAPSPSLVAPSSQVEDPYTNTPPGVPCICVVPMRVGLRLGVALLTFFPLVSELAKEVASGVFLNQSQVRIMGANTANPDPDETDVLLDLVPLGGEFGYSTAIKVYNNLWQKKVDIRSSFFGRYRVLFVIYPGLPPSPPSALTDITIEETGQLPNGNPSRTKPLAADFRKRKDRLDGGLIAFIVLSSTILLTLFVGAIWLYLWKQRDNTRQRERTLQTLLPQVNALGRSAIFGSESRSPSPSFSSSIAAYAGSAKTFSLGEIEKATNNFHDSAILGEGGFGRVYKGTIGDGTKVAVKVLKRDDHHGGREFLAEVEMLSRLHHRNLVKLIGICTEEHNRCLVYELIPNGSVESHLHGMDRETAPLDWDARLKIALGSARGLSYLHEDSSPRVIHRDFKSSNILLEFDYTPKVSDFGLAKTALDEENEHISTRVMGTFGYVAPEYAMTGHLLVKSDVYSYGVVLLELLTGRKPVDMTQPPGQENLVNWARPLLTTKEGLEIIIDPALGPDFPLDSVAKVAAIASTCVQPEVSHRPFMGEVVQALKLVCNECDEKKAGSGSYSQEDFSAQDTDTRISIASGQLPESHLFMMSNYGSSLEAERVLSTSDVFCTSARFTRHESAHGG